MATVRVRDITIGEGIPKICVPIVGKTANEILDEAARINKLDFDLVEWRADWFDTINDAAASVSVAQQLNSILSDDRALLFTIRTAAEGGNYPLPVDDYVRMNKAAIDSGVIDIVDVELFLGDEVMKDLISYAHDHEVAVIASNHDFAATPPRAEIITRLTRMQDLGADILKIAVMPNSDSDVIELLAATEEMANNHATQPIVTMSMGGRGSLSRICGELFGSAITFGCASQASAPGQIGVEDLHTILTLLHKSLGN